MIKIKGNWLLGQIIIVYAIFIFSGLLIIPKPFMSSGTAIFELMAGALMAWRYAPSAARVLFREERGKYGAHDAILGAAELSIGLIYSGIYRLAFIYFNPPPAEPSPAWINTMWGALGIFAMAKGCFRLAFSPDGMTSGHRFPEGFKMVLLWAFGLVIAFAAGTNFSGFGQ